MDRKPRGDLNLSPPAHVGAVRGCGIAQVTHLQVPTSEGTHGADKENQGDNRRAGGDDGRARDGGRAREMMPVNHRKVWNAPSISQA